MRQLKVKNWQRKHFLNSKICERKIWVEINEYKNESSSWPDRSASDCTRWIHMWMVNCVKENFDLMKHFPDILLQYVGCTNKINAAGCTQGFGIIFHFPPISTNRREIIRNQSEQMKFIFWIFHHIEIKTWEIALFSSKSHKLSAVKAAKISIANRKVRIQMDQSTF